jgi:hypothetical protein
MRFGLMSIPGSGSTAMAELRPAEGAGVDVIATADHLRHPRDARLPLLDGWSVAAAWAGAFRGIRRSLVAYRPIAPWSGPDAFQRLIDTVAQLGFDELIVYPPTNDDERRAFERAVGQRQPQYRSAGAAVVAPTSAAVARTASESL